MHQSLYVLGRLLQKEPGEAVSHTLVPASGRPPAAPVGACQGISHFISLFVASPTIVFLLKDIASKAIPTASFLHLGTAYLRDFLGEISGLGHVSVPSRFKFKFLFL